MNAILHRPLQVARLLKREIIVLMRDKVKDPRLNQLVVTDVEVSKNCAHAKVYISIPAEGDEQQILRAAAKASGFLRSKLSSNLALRFIPKLSFKIDNSYEQGERIDSILDEETNSRT